MATTTTSRHRDNHRSLSPSGRFCSSSLSTTTTPTFSTSTSPFHRASSPTRISLTGPHSLSSNPTRKIISLRNTQIPTKKKHCSCSPTTHAGSFRCNFHKQQERKREKTRYIPPTSYHALNMRRSAMTNSLVRIGTVEGGESVKRALTTLIRPSSHQQRRRGDFQPRPSRLSRMSSAPDL